MICQKNVHPKLGLYGFDVLLQQLKVSSNCFDVCTSILGADFRTPLLNTCTSIFLNDFLILLLCSQNYYYTVIVRTLNAKVLKIKCGKGDCENHLPLFFLSLFLIFGIVESDIDFLVFNRFLDC